MKPTMRIAKLVPMRFLKYGTGVAMGTGIGSVIFLFYALCAFAKHPLVAAVLAVIATILFLISNIGKACERRFFVEKNHKIT